MSYCSTAVEVLVIRGLREVEVEALSYARAELLPSPKRIRRSELATNLKGCSEDSFESYVTREVGLEVDFEDESFEPSRSRGTDLEMDFDVEPSSRD
ncbi:hypothetical protein Tco_0822894 [Tanacetum coccineum]|uniref:Uncharacterized protein n=1 Tax=Tanacetum coccineum TaxID=301880 RepID=A0ABQ5AGD8_9ASTR